MVQVQTRISSYLAVLVKGIVGRKMKLRLQDRNLRVAPNYQSLIYFHHVFGEHLLNWAIILVELVHVILQNVGRTHKVLQMRFETL